MKKSIAALALTTCLAGSASAQTFSFLYTGQAQTWTVPSGVDALDIQSWAAGGGISGGSSAYVAGLLLVSPGQTLTLEVGGASGGVGYAYGVSDVLAGNGGGGSFLFLDGTLVAATGGGAGGTQVTIGAHNTRGGGGGGTYVGGLPGNNANAGTATGGTQTAGGSVNGGYMHGGDPTGPGAGGGGGYYGGGGGSGANVSQYSLFPGAGGSSYGGGLLGPTLEDGLTGSISGNVLPGGATAPNYVTGVGIGGIGKGGNGMIVLMAAPVPEPSSIIALGFGGFALLLRRRRP